MPAGRRLRRRRRRRRTGNKSGGKSNHDETAVSPRRGHGDVALCGSGARHRGSSAAPLPRSLPNSGAAVRRRRACRGKAAAETQQDKETAREIRREEEEEGEEGEGPGLVEVVVAEEARRRQAGTLPRVDSPAAGSGAGVGGDHHPPVWVAEASRVSRGWGPGEEGIGIGGASLLAEVEMVSLVEVDNRTTCDDRHAWRLSFGGKCGTIGCGDGESARRRLVCGEGPVRLWPLARLFFFFFKLPWCVYSIK